MDQLTPGKKVRFVGGPFGLVDEVSLYKFIADDSAFGGELGKVVDSIPIYGSTLPEGWILVKHDRSGYYVPVHPTMVEEADDASV